MAPRIKIKTAAKLLDFFWPEFKEIEGSIFLSWETVRKICDPELGINYTGMEAFINHNHIVDLFRHEVSREPTKDNDSWFDYSHPDFKFLCEVGKKLAQMWYRKLKIDFPQYRFRVYYTQEDDPIVRFHRVRPEEPYWLDEANWRDDIKHGKIMIYDTEKER
jgi:hypothetical protein